MALQDPLNFKMQTEKTPASSSLFPSVLYPTHSSLTGAHPSQIAPTDAYGGGLEGSFAGSHGGVSDFAAAYRQAGTGMIESIRRLYGGMMEGAVAPGMAAATYASPLAHSASPAPFLAASASCQGFTET